MLFSFRAFMKFKKLLGIEFVLIYVSMNFLSLIFVLSFLTDFALDEIVRYTKQR